MKGLARGTVSVIKHNSAWEKEAEEESFGKAEVDFSLKNQRFSKEIVVCWIFVGCLVI